MDKVLYFIFLLLLLISTHHSQLAKHYLLLKTGTSLLFCLIAINNINNFNLSLVPILLCAIGDVFLAFYNRKAKLPYFIIGGLFFLSAHFSFILYFHRILNYRLQDIIVPILSCLLVLYWDLGRHIHIKKVRPLAYVYAFVIGLLLAKGLHILYYMNNTFGLSVALASSLFYLSDCMIIFMYFQKKTPKRHLFNLSTYYISMFIFAMII